MSEHFPMSWFIQLRAYLSKKVNFNSSRYRLYQAVAEFSSQIPPGARVLDAGAGEAPYRSLFGHTNYHSADFTKVDKIYEKPSYVCDLAAIPVVDEWYDYILFTQVIEHLPEPLQVLKELRRLLKSGGKIFITGPLFYEEHEQPYDFYRYTQYGLRYLLEQAGLVVEQMDWLEGYYGTIGYEFNRMARYLPWKPQDLGRTSTRYGLSILFIGMKLLFLLMSICFHRLELYQKYVAAGYPKNYMVIASKQ
jgi:SAM-dependent methyltransferase